MLGHRGSEFNLRVFGNQVLESYGAQVSGSKSEGVREIYFSKLEGD